MQADHLVVDDAALGVEVAGVEQLLELPAHLAVSAGHPLQVAEDAAEGDVAGVVQAGVAPDGDSPLVLGVEDLALGLLIQGTGDIDAGDLGPETRGDRLDRQRHGVSHSDQKIAYTKGAT